MTKTIEMIQHCGDFAENKEIARCIRLDEIIPALSEGKGIVLDFKGVDGATQSFIHALISDPIRQFRDAAYENLYYQNTNREIKEIISMVYRYMQESLDSADD